MAAGQLTNVIRHLRRSVLLDDGGGMTDGQLLECYLAQREEAAFEALVRRYGPMVLGVCRRVLRHTHDAEDAFQATFLVLVRKAASILPRDRVGNWLYGVAYRTSMKARAMSTKRRAKERQAAETPKPVEDEIWPVLQPLLDRELNRLPDKYRQPIVLCDLEGKSRRVAARQLGWAEGTVATRLATARRMLAKRLARHSLALPASALAVPLWQKGACASVPAPLVVSTVKAATVFAAGQAAATDIISAKVAALTGGVLKAMLMTKLKSVMAVALLLSAIALGLGAGSYRLLAGDDADAKKADRMPPPAKAPVDPLVEDTADGRLPAGPEPSQALVSLAEDGRLAVKRALFAYHPQMVAAPDGDSVSFRAVPTNQLSRQLFALTEIEVLDTKGKRLNKGLLPKLLEVEVPALVYSGPQPIDPLHLRLIKDGTLVFVLPYSPSVEPPAPPLAPVPPVPRQLEREKGNRKSGEAAQPDARVRQIVIVGNEKTSDKIILRAIQLSPGQVLSYPELKKAERSLERLNLFEVNPKEGVRPTVTVVDSDGPFKDILVTVKEKGGASKR